MLKQEFGVTRIIVFGSLVKHRFHPDSDIDIAAEGIPAADYFAAVAAVNRVSRRWVDLKPLESLDSHFRDRVLAEGTIIDVQTTEAMNKNVIAKREERRADRPSLARVHRGRTE